MEQRIMRLILVTLVLSNVILAGSLVFVRILWKIEPQREQPLPAAGQIAVPEKALLPEERETPKMLEELRIETLAMLRGQINVLKQESAQESLDRLSERTMFDFTTPFAGGYPNPVAYEMPPVDDQEARRDLMRILCNRRVVKLLEELARMPRNEVVALVSSHLEKNLDAYRSQLAKGSASPLAARAKENEPNIETMRLSLGALVILAGTLELTETSGTLRAIAQLALDQREEAYEKAKTGGLEMIAVYNTLVTESLYNRIVLCTGLLGVGIGATAFESIGRPWTELELAPFDSLVSPIDPPGLRGDIIPNYSRGRVRVRHLEDLQDDEFDSLLGVEKTRL